ncbi:MAG: hypothetical protein MR590_01375 [Clostridiales bacterium]|nr:hypothetical protein [Clostridiales bacterium]
MDSIQIYNHENSTVAISSKKHYIIKTENSFYYPTEEVFFQAIDKNKLELVEVISDNPLVSIGMLVVISLMLVYYFWQVSYVIVDKNFLISTLVLLFNVAVHECGHIITLKLLYPRSKIKLGFKFVFIYPAFYVDTSYSYFLPKYKRIAVYLAGNTANAIFVLLSMLLFPQFNQYLYLVVSNVLINFLPIVKSDGYYAFISLLGRYNIAKSKKATFVENFIRGLLMFLLLEALSYFT